MAIARIAEDTIITEVIDFLNFAEHSILATRLCEDDEQNAQYEQKIVELQKRGIKIQRKVFSREGGEGALDVRQHPFLRMLLIDENVLFFGIPLGEKYQFHRTDDPVLIAAYRSYFESLPT